MENVENREMEKRFCSWRGGQLCYRSYLVPNDTQMGPGDCLAQVSDSTITEVGQSYVLYEATSSGGNR